MARITVINDYREFLELMDAILAGTEGHVGSGFSAEEAGIEDVVASRPDVLIIDVTVGEIRDDRWAITKVRAMQGLASVPIIVCSGDLGALDQHRLRADEAAAVYTLRKPFVLDQLIGVVDLALAERKSAAGAQAVQ